MISALTGTVKSVATNQVVIELGPLECSLQVPNGTRYAIGSSLSLCIYMHWSAENGPSFYGFASELDKAVFMLIISCSGIGPKIGLAALDNLGAHGILEALQLGTVRALSSISGIGPKKAEYMIMHLKDKIAPLLASSTLRPQTKTLEQWQTISLTLESLSYSRPEINMAMDHLKTVSQQQELSFDQLLRKALTFLSK